MAPINLPDGTEVSKVILPDGSAASEVIAPDGSTVFAGIPDSVVNRVPFTEGSGTTAAATVGSADVTLNNGGDWISSGEFRGGTTAEFGASGEDGQWSPYTNIPITITTRVRIDPNGLPSPFFNYIYYFQGSGDSGAGLVGTPNSNEWIAADNNATNTARVGDSLNGGDVRILAYRLRSSEMRLDVYQKDATTKVGSASVSNPDTSFSSSTLTVGNDPSDRTFGDSIDLTDIYDVFLSDSQLDANIAKVYG